MIEPKFIKFKGDCLAEPSGSAQLPDGRFIVVNDTKHSKALYVLKLNNNGRLKAKKLDVSNSPKMDDLEGIVVLGSYVYAITSHDRNRNRKRRIVRFLVEGNKIKNPENARGAKRLKARVKKALIVKYPRFDDSDFNGKKFNIEGFCVREGDFLIGLRGPKLDDMALVVKTHGLSASFGDNKSRYGITAECNPLPLKDGGIRAMTHVEDLGGYLIVSGKSSTDDDKEEFSCRLANMKSKFLLWFWDGKDDCREILCWKKKQDDVKIQPEGINPVIIDGKNTLLFVSDDGKDDDNKTGRYWLLKPEEYQELKNRVVG